MFSEYEPGTVYWITGLSGAGKTTIGKLLYNYLRHQKPNVFFLDGDMGRLAFNDSIGYTKKARKEGAYRNGRVCKMIAMQGIDVVCCTISMFDEVREWNKKNIANYIEVFLDVPIEVLIQRDQKGLYSKSSIGRIKDVVGLDQQPEYPKNPYLRIVNDGAISPEDVLKKIIQIIKH